MGTRAADRLAAVKAEIAQLSKIEAALTPAVVAFCDGTAAVEGYELETVVRVIAAWEKYKAITN